MSEVIKKLEKDITEEFEDVSVDVDGPTFGGTWFVDMVTGDGHHVNVEWEEEKGFSLIGNRKIIFGERGDETYTDYKEALMRIVELLDSGEATGESE